MDVARPIERQWDGEPCFVVGSGPSLTPQVAHKIRMARWLDSWRVLVVNDAYRMLPLADALYAADGSWWREHGGAPHFGGQKWTIHGLMADRSQLATEFGLNLVQGFDQGGFSRSQCGIRTGGIAAHSGFQAVNLAMLFGADPIVLCGFDYRGSHFFGDHQNLRQALPDHYEHMASMFDSVECDARIINSTPESRLKRFNFMDLDEVLRRYDRVHRHRPEPHALAG